MRTITVQPGATINLGQQYDNEASEVLFPASLISKITDIFGPEGNFYIWYIRNGDSEGYPIGPPLVTYSGGQVRWTITEADVAKPGPAQVQLRYIALDAQVMSKVFRAMVYNSVDIGDDVPEPMEPWADAIMAALEDIHEVPAGGTTGQVLAKASDDDYDLEWTDQSGGGSSISPYTSNPAALGTASPGSSDDYARGDHVHPKPTAADIGAIAAPQSPSSGQFLVYNGSAWVAMSLSTWQGGNY